MLFAEVTIPVGDYRLFRVMPPCGIAGVSGPHKFDDPNAFYDAIPNEVGLVWMHNGYLEYVVPSPIPVNGQAVFMEVSVEICSDAPAYKNDWPSDITLWINGQDIGTWRCPGDFGGRRGRYTPLWWSEADTQFGLLKTWKITHEGTRIDDELLSATALSEVNPTEGTELSIRFGVKPEAQNVGGLNLFGSTFGDYAQDILVRIGYEP